MSSATTESSPLKLAFGSGHGGEFSTGLPVLAGDSSEEFFRQATPAGRLGGLNLFRLDHWLLGVASVALPCGLETAAHELYRDIFQAARGLHLARVWNYIPAINAEGPGGLENYRLFCRGRSLAFEENYGDNFKALLPSASGVGCMVPALTVSFAASSVAPRHIENPLQIPAYEYPAEYGPRAPSFARATVIAKDGRATAFISGTAAIRGHATVAPDDLRGQLDCTVENLREISAACDLGSDLDRAGSASRHFKVYLRNPADQPFVAKRLEQEFLTDLDRVSYVRADICREALLVEIEATLFGLKG